LSNIAQSFKAVASGRKKIFYGWWMVAGGFVIQFLTSGLVNQSYGAYVVLLRDEFGWSKTQLSGAYSMQQLIGGVLGPGQGWIIDRFGPRTLMQIGVVILGVGFILFGQVHSLLAFYGSFVVISIGWTLSGFFPLTVAIVNWFERRRALAMSTMSVGFAFGGVAIPLVAFSLEQFGWRHTAVGSGILIMAVGLPLTQLFRSRPENYGHTVDGVAPSEARPGRQAAAIASGRRDFTFREAVRTRAFWMINFGHASALLVVSAVNVHVVSHLTSDLGYSLGAASLVVTLMTSMQVVGMIVGGLLGDRTDNSALATVAMGMHMAGLLLVSYAGPFPMVVGFAVLHGLAWGLRGPLMQSIRADYFGRTSFGMIMGFSGLIVMLGNIFGPLVAGFLADTTGSYRTGFTVLALLAGLGSVFFILAKRPELPTAERSKVMAAVAE
jgi:sugar phosphate permease